jgi:DNA polymerase-4
MSSRSILHVDMDAFFAAVEVLDNPRLAGKPVIVGGTPEGRGVVSTASYEARKFGVRSAMPAAQAVKLCPHGVFLRPRMGRYADMSRQVFAILHEVTPLVEPVSIDEAFLDVTGCHPLARSSLPAAEALAKEIQGRVERVTGGLTCSLGVAENKFLAKVASDLRKPRGLTVVPTGGGAEFLAPLPIERLWGVGPKTSERLRSLGLTTIGQIAALKENDLEAILGAEFGRHLRRLSRGLDDRQVETGWEAKSISQETTFAQFLAPSDREAIDRVLFSLADGVAERLREETFWARTVTLKVRDENFKTCTRAKTLESPTQVVEEIFSISKGLFWQRIRLGGRKVRLLGVAASQLTREPLRQLDLFDKRAERQATAEQLARVADEIKRKLGDKAITRARLLGR